MLKIPGLDELFTDLEERGNDMQASLDRIIILLEKISKQLAES